MADYSALKATIDNTVNTNGTQAITGAILNTTLKAMVDALGDGYKFMGVATTSTNPQTPDGNVFYLASGAGRYPFFGNIQVFSDEVALFVYESNWTKYATIATSKAETGENYQIGAYKILTDLYGDQNIYPHIITNERAIDYGPEEKQGYARTGLFPSGLYDFSAVPNGYQYAIFLEDHSQRITWRPGAITNVNIAQDFYITFRRTPFVTTDFLRSEADAIEAVFAVKKYSRTRTYKELVDKVFGIEWQPTFSPSVASDVLVEMYFPNITSDWKITNVTCQSNKFRLGFKDGDGITHLYGLGNDSQILGGKYSDLIQEFVDNKTNTVLGYFILHYRGTDYQISSSTGYNMDVSVVTDINNSPRIKEYLSRKKNLVLVGDSLFGKAQFNILAPMLRSLTDRKVYNVAFAGCNMAWRSSDGSNNYDYFSFVNLADSIVANDYTAMENHRSIVSDFEYQIGPLKAIDWSQDTLMLVGYGNNDLTQPVAIGDLWEDGDTINDFTKNTYLGAANYGIAKLMTEYPDLEIVMFTQGWRRINNLPPYLYENANGNKVSDFVTALKENCSRQGVSVYDFLSNGGRNNYNIISGNIYDQGVTYDGSHFNVLGFDRLAHLIMGIVNGVIK